MLSFRSLARIVLAACVCSAFSCSPNGDSENQPEATPQQVVQQKKDPPPKKPKQSAPETQPKPAEEPEPLIKTSFLNPDSAQALADKFPGLSTEAATQQVLSNVVDATEFGSALVVWMLDRTDTASDMVKSVMAELEDFYGRLKDHPKRTSVQSAVMTFGGDVQFLLEDPSDDPQQVIDALSKFQRGDSSGKEMIFTALKQARDRYLTYRTKQRFYVTFVVVTDEAGDDAAVIDEIIPDFQRYSLAVYTIGAPAPFGRTEAETGKEPSILQGPESCFLERLKLAFWGDPHGLNLMDSGFGPFHLERICRASGGQFLAIRPDSGGKFFNPLDIQWPNPHVLRFDPAVMRKYAPEYTSQQEYLQMVSANAARKALHEAAKMSMGDILAYPPVQFVVRNEAKLQQDLSGAQRVAAVLEPQIERIYTTLDQGLGDRDALTEPRWQAGFDLAIGRAAAAKARIDGYNAMLAALKRGKAFENEESDRWFLESAEVTEEAGGTILRLGTDARMYLERVVKEHPNTPWAVIAERELTTPIGWKWVEQGP